MIQSIISKGRNVEEAIYIGLAELDARKSEVDIEVIQQEKNGFIGMGKKHAIVRLSLSNKQENQNPFQEDKKAALESVDSLIDELPEFNETEKNEEIDQSPEIIPEDLSLGTVWVEDGKLYVKDSIYKFATVTIGEGIQLFKNGRAVTQHSTVISEEDQFEIRVEPNEESETTWKITLDSSRLNAILHVDPGFLLQRKVEDVEPSEHVDLKLVKTKEIRNTLQYKEVLARLDELRVVYGFNHSQIVEAVNATEQGDFIIATGKSAEPGQNGWIDFKVQLDAMNGLVEDEAGNINFRDVNLIPTVEAGSIVGIIHPPVPGKPGITVTNEPLPAKQTTPVNVVAGKGMEVTGDKLVATEPGRPSVEKRGQLVKAKIVPKLFHHGNVNIASGNIRFRGDVEITGEVEENMIVQTDGDILVHKTVSIATLTTLNSIVVKGNVIGSELDAGKNNMLIVELGHLLGIMHKQLGQMISVVQQLQKSPAFKSTDFDITGLQPLIMILLEKRFKTFIPYAKNYQEVVEKGQAYLDDEEWLQVGVAVKQIFLSLTNQVTTLERLRGLEKKMEELSELSKIPVEPNAYITISDTINSRLYSSGDISIIGKGCINSKVHAGGKLKINGILRGGEVYGRLGVSITECGSVSGVKTIVAVPEDQKIQIKKAYENTILKIGKVTTIIKDERKHILAKLSENGTIVFE